MNKIKKIFIKFLLFSVIALLIGCPESGDDDDSPDINMIRITYSDGISINPSLVWTGSGYGLSWQDDRDGNYEIYFAQIGN